MADHTDPVSTFRRMVVGNDGSDSAARALAWAGRLAQRSGAEVVVARMFSPVEAEVSPEVFDELEQDASGDVERIALELLGPLGISYRTMVEPGTPDGLLRLGDDLDADLIVVGTRGEGGFAALHIGSTAHHLAHRAERPLAIIPIAGADASFDRIVVGIDGSTGSTSAAAWGGALAMSTGSEVIAVQSFEPYVEWVPDSDPQSVMSSVAHDTDECTAAMRAQGVQVRTQVVKDVHPVAALAAAVEQESAGVAVVGRRGHGGLAGQLLGGVPERLLHHTHIPVVVVPSRLTGHEGKN